jgi:type I restriction enzyme M protein
MLDNETKRKIDSARSILVGKVPDPKAQVEQITTALIYKFMDDMDREAEELGGNAKFLVGELDNYKWANLMDKSLGGSERLNLYMSALLAFAKASNIPEIFRTIFKDAFLPYRDPETLNLFLKEIDYFDYDHSENLGNAFEYLLSILGSQGDAGQFRTPRHIIDFIVQVLEPKKNETILDPACGTAGFLISAYKYIMANNKLSPDEKKSLMQNFTGYDISPDMVRLSLVNMYLHSFPTPKVYEYDTLTSEDRWNESFDVILANPPFMTPKGGIRPHNRFSVKANRSEVLFVDYIAEHLSLNGRAGVIVPEGIIFQSANAYKALRKMLVDNSFLWAVVSLPAGVFQPYSGVKTSILLLDRNIAKRSENILFVKISNDGYDLGAQRRKIAKNDLPEALEVLKKHRNGEAVESTLAHIVPKTKISESGDYNLTGDRYRENTRAVQTAYPMASIQDLFELGRGRVISKQDIEQNRGVYPVYSSQTTNNGIFGYLNSYDFEGEYITWTTDGANAGTVFYREGKFNCTNVCGILKPKKEIKNQLNLKFCALVTNHVAYNYVVQVGNPKLMNKEMGRIEIPLPPLEIQNQIVAQIEEWQKIIDGAKQVINSYRPTITIDPSWEMVKLGDVCEVISGQSPESEHYNQDGDGLPFYQGKTEFTEMLIGKPKVWTRKITKVSEKNDILMSIRAPVGPVNIAVQKSCIGRGLAAIRASKQIDFLYLFYLLKNIQDDLKGNGGAVFDSINRKQIGNLKIPLPPLEIQNQIVEQIEKERQAVESCKSLVAMFEAKIKAKIDEVWGKAADE